MLFNALFLEPDKSSLIFDEEFLVPDFLEQIFLLHRSLSLVLSGGSGGSGVLANA